MWSHSCLTGRSTRVQHKRRRPRCDRGRPSRPQSRAPGFEPPRPARRADAPATYRTISGGQACGMEFETCCSAALGPTTTIAPPPCRAEVTRADGAPQRTCSFHPSRWSPPSRNRRRGSGITAEAVDRAGGSVLLVRRSRTGDARLDLCIFRPVGEWDPLGGRFHSSPDRLRRVGQQARQYPVGPPGPIERRGLRVAKGGCRLSAAVAVLVDGGGDLAADQRDFIYVTRR